MPDRIGKYEIQSELGVGGFGRVYRAYDPSMGRSVAIKVLMSHGEPDPDLLARFRAEAGLTGKLQHKNIVTVYDSGEQDGSPYIVMQLLEGVNLQKILEDKRQFTLLEKMQMMCQIAEGLNYAHSAGVVHRDVKPGNIMLLPSGLIKIMDFGIARLVGGGTSRKTRRGDLIGTTSYMSPEQFRGSDADIQSDVFACGVIFYELLTGVHPFEATDVSAVIFRIMSIDPLPLCEVAPGCPHALETLVHRAMAKERSRRYTGLDEVLLDAEPILLDFRRDQAAALVAEITELMKAGEFDLANSKLKRALELDSTNKEARRIRETLHEERNRRLIAENIAALEREGASKLINRQFADACQKLEAALRLKPEDPRIKGLVENARARLLANREAGKLLSEAKREAQIERFYEARALAAKASETDPDHPEVPALIRHLDESIERMESAKRLRAGLATVEGLLGDKQYDSAIAKLESLEIAHPSSHEINELHARVRGRQMEDFRKHRAAKLEDALDRARAMYQDDRLVEASDILGALAGDFPGIAAVETFRTIIQEDLASMDRASRRNSLLLDARNLLWERRIGEAVALLEANRKTFTPDSAIERLLDACRALVSDTEREDGVSKLVDRLRWLRKHSQFDEAQDLVRSTIRLHGQDTVLSDLSRLISLEIEDRRSSERLLRYRRDAGQLLSAGSAGEALALLREAKSQYPGEPSLELLFSAAEEEFTNQNEQELVATVLREAAQQEAQGNLAAASEEINKGLRRMPTSKELVRAAADLRDRAQSLEREKKIESFIAAIREALNNSDWNLAKATVTAAQRDYPDKLVFDELNAQIGVRQRAAEADKALAKVREHLDKGNLELAAVGLAELEPVYGSDEPWKVAKQRLERRQAFLGDLRSADSLRRARRYPEAEELLARLVLEDPSDAPAAALLKTVRSEMAADLDYVIGERKKEAQNLADNGRISDALQLLTDLSEQYPNDARASEAVREMKARASARPRIQFSEKLGAAVATRIARPTCAGCGTLLADRARFCDNCGRQVAS